MPTRITKNSVITASVKPSYAPHSRPPHPELLRLHCSCNNVLHTSSFLGVYLRRPALLDESSSVPTAAGLFNVPGTSGPETLNH